MLAYLTGVTFKELNTFEVQLIMDSTPHQSLVRVAIDERSFPSHSIQVTKGEEECVLHMEFAHCFLVSGKAY
jgi:hypothetical protein